MTDDIIGGAIIMIILLAFYFSDHTDYNSVHKNK